MAILKCKMCGGDLEVMEDMTVAECEYCGTKQTVPNVDDEKKLKLFERANKLRSNCEFDKAAGVYENIVADYSEEAEGYWGLILCRYGIEYVDDPATGKKIPTCHRSSFDSIMDDEDFEMVMENADSVSRAVYREEAKYIEELRKGIIEVSGKEEPYDIFICYKETDENGDRTLDSVLAQDVYDELTQKGYRVFFSRITLEDKLGVEYEPYIFAALNSAKIMLAFGTSYDYYNAVWVKNEWSRYLKLMAKDKTKHLIPCFKNVDAYDIPKEFAKLQSQDMGKIGAVQDLMRGIEKLLTPAAQSEKNIVTENVVMNGMNMNGNTFMKRGYMALEDKEWSKAIDFFEQVLNINAEEARAYWGELLAEYKCSNNEELYAKTYMQIKDSIKEKNQVVDLDSRYEECAKKYVVLEVFTEEEKKNIFYPQYKYKTMVSEVEDAISKNKNSFVLASNRLYQRTLQYADANLKKEVEDLIQNVDMRLQELLKDAQEKEAEEMRNANVQADEYYSMLREALETPNRIAAKKAEISESEYQESMQKWQNDRDSIDLRKTQWEDALAKYRTDYAEWKQLNERLLQQWGEEKTKYAETKKRLENEINELENKKKNPYAFVLSEKRLDEKIFMLKNQVAQLKIPQQPSIASRPVEPQEPVLESMPICVKFTLKEKLEIKEIFFRQWKLRDPANNMINTISNTNKNALQTVGAPAGKSVFDVELVDAGIEKVKVIKVIRELTGLGLPDASAIVQSAPRVIKRAVSKEKAILMKQKLEDIGAKINLK